MTFKAKRCPFCGDAPKIEIAENPDTATSVGISISCCSEVSGTIVAGGRKGIEKNAQEFIDLEWNYREGEDALFDAIAFAEKLIGKPLEDAIEENGEDEMFGRLSLLKDRFIEVETTASPSRFSEWLLSA